MVRGENGELGFFFYLDVGYKYRFEILVWGLDCFVE